MSRAFQTTKDVRNVFRQQIITLTCCALADINECLSTNMPCPAGQICINTDGSYTCQPNHISLGNSRTNPAMKPAQINVAQGINILHIYIKL